MLHLAVGRCETLVVCAPEVVLLGCGLQGSQAHVNAASIRDLDRKSSKLLLTVGVETREVRTVLAAAVVPVLYNSVLPPTATSMQALRSL